MSKTLLSMSDEDKEKLLDKAVNKANQEQREVLSESELKEQILKNARVTITEIVYSATEKSKPKKIITIPLDELLALTLNYGREQRIDELESCNRFYAKQTAKMKGDYNPSMSMSIAKLKGYTSKYIDERLEALKEKEQS